MKDSRNNRIGRYLFALLIFSCVVDLVSPMIIGMGYPGYEPLHETISGLGTTSSPVRFYVSLTLIIVGLAFIVYAVWLKAWLRKKSQVVTRWHTLYIIGILAFGIGTVIAGIFPEDPVGVSETMNGKIHGIASAFGFILLFLSFLWAPRMERLEKHKLFNYLIFTGAMITFALLLASEGITTGPIQYTGLFQRINLAVVYLGLVINHAWLIGLFNDRKGEVM